MYFEAKARTHGRALIVELTGELDLSCAPRLRQELCDSLDAVPLIVDLSNLDFIDAQGLSVLADINKKTHFLRLVRGNERIQKVFEMTGLTRTMRFYDTPTQAINAPFFS